MAPTTAATYEARSQAQVGDLPTSKPERPVEALTADTVGAAATILYWVRALNYAYASGDIDPLVDASGYQCGQCAAIASDVTDQFARGMQQTGGAVVVQTTIFNAQELDVWAFTLTQSRYPGQRVYDDGTIEQLPAEAALVEGRVLLQEADDAGDRRLVVLGLTPVDSSAFGG